MGWEDRVFALTPIEGKAALLAHFGVAAWPLCTAFEFGGLIFANCSRTSARVPEFAVIREQEQIAHLPLARMSRQEVSSTLDSLLAGAGHALGAVALSTELAVHHHCALCQARRQGRQSPWRQGGMMTMHWESHDDW